MYFYGVNCMNKCNVPRKKILVVSNNKFSQEIVLLRKIVVQAKTLPLAIALFKVVIFFILSCRFLLIVRIYPSCVF